MQPESSQAPKTQKSGYGKRPMWQWVAIYVVVAIVVYGVAFAAYRHYHHSSSSSSSTGSSSSGGGLY